MKLYAPKILYTDDDTDDYELMKEALIMVAPGHTLHYVRDSESFLAEVRGFLPDLIFLDYNMPVWNGKDCLEAIQSDFALRQIPIVMYSTSSAQNILTECYSLGAVKYLLKPIHYNDIVTGLHLILDLYYEGGLLPSGIDEFFIDTRKAKLGKGAETPM
jgi:CheY-like chemotaxis protein